MKNILIAFGLAAATCIAPAAQAAVTTVDFSFDRLDGSSVGHGSFSFDSALSGPLTYSDLDSFSLTIGGNSYDLGFVNSGNFSVYHYFGFNTVANAFVTQTVSGFPTILAGLKNSYNEGFFVRNDPAFTLARAYPGGELYFDNVSIVTSSGAVPEAATWAMMIMGFGLVGASLRRRAVAHAA